MPVPISRLLKHHKLDPKSLKAAFDAKSIEERPKVKDWISSMSDTMREGLEKNRRDYRLFKAMDWAMDQPFYQVSYTQLRGLLSNKPDNKKVMETVNSWGLTHLLPTVTENGRICCNQDGSEKKALNLPFLTNVFIPIVMAYHTIRLAKLFNDRNLTPLYKYEPVQFTKENRVRCEVVTQVIQRQSTWFDYKSDERQSISQMLQYGYCINFPREAWFVDTQEDESGKDQIMREGLRFNMPHPSRMYFDSYHRLSTLNSNSGCEYAGYWGLERYKDIHDNPHYWNKERIPFGGHNWLDIGVSDFLSEVYPCTMSFPPKVASDSLDRESDAGGFYSQGTFNAATLKTEHFHRLVPKDHGLGTYKYPIWMRFVVASENTVIWAEPLSFDRFPTYCYDADFNRSRFRSLGLEVMPFQDQIGNLLSQWGMAVRENLRNPIFVDKEKIPASALIALENHGNKMYSGREYIPFSSTDNYRLKDTARDAFFTPILTHHNTAEIAQLINGVLDMLDRIMQLSPQEIGQAASHEQTAEETREIAGSRSTRISFTGSFVDDAIYARKVMLYDATMAHADDEIIVGISSSFAATEEEFKTLIKNVGLTIHDDSDYDPNNPGSVRTVKLKKSAIRLESFASTRESDNRINTAAIADAMSKIFIAVANNPVLVQSIGAVQLVELLNQIIVTTGLPKEFRLKGKPIDPNLAAEEQAKQMGEMMTKFAEQVKELVAESQEQTLEAAGKQTVQVVQQSQEAVGKALQAIAEREQAVEQAVKQLVPVIQKTAEDNTTQGEQIAQLGEALKKLNEAIQIEAQAIAQVAQQQVPPPSPQTLQPPPPGFI